jgi:hypothetical protein
MKAALGGLVVIVTVVLAVLALVDVARAPSPSPGTCVFQDRLVLPDICVSGCPGCATCPTATTRPYLFFWTEAAGCPGFCICITGRNQLEITDERWTSSPDCFPPQRGGLLTPTNEFDAVRERVRG